MLTKPQIFIIGAAGFLVLFFILVFLGVIPGINGNLQKKTQSVELNFWGIENKENFQPLIDSYRAAMATQGADVKINYKQFSEGDYEKNLINALAAGQGPDIFMFHNSWLPKHIAKISSAPIASSSLAQTTNLFPQIVESDFVRDGNLYALPLSIDTMAMIYNRDYFDRHGIATTIFTWTDLQNIISSLREIDNQGRIIKAPVAMGISEKSIDRASDLLNLLMLQFGAIMNAQDQSSDSSAVGFGRDNNALSALNFYLQFGESKSSNYSWNESMGYSLDSFAAGNTAIIFDYASSLPIIKAKNPFLNLQVAPMLQFDLNNPVNYANYYGLAVSAQSRQAAWAWNFILYSTTDPSAADQYIKTAKEPPALRILIQKYQNNSDLGIFARQVLTAKSWRQKDNIAVKQIFSNMIDSILSGQTNSESALKQAEGAINSL